MTCTAKTQKILYYVMTTFFDLSSIETMYRTNTNVAEDGISALNRYALTNNEQQFFDRLLKRAAAKTQELLQTFNRDLDDSFGFNSLPGNTVEELNDLEEWNDGLLIIMEDAGTLTLGAVDVIIGSHVYYDETTSVWILDDAETKRYIWWQIELPTYYDVNNLFSLDQKIEEYISMYVVNEWFKRQKYDFSVVAEELENLERGLGRIVNFRTKFTRPVSLI